MISCAKCPTNSPHFYFPAFPLYSPCQAGIGGGAVFAESIGVSGGSSADVVTVLSCQFNNNTAQINFPSFPNVFRAAFSCTSLSLLSCLA